MREWEPTEALVGRGITELLADRASAVLRPGRTLVLEVAGGTAPAVSALLEARGYRDVRATRDLAGRDRVVEGRWKP